VTDWRKLLAGALTGAICLFGLTATVDASGQRSHRPDTSRVKRTEWDRKPTDNPKLDRKLNDRSDRGGVGLSRVIVTMKPGVDIDGLEYLAKYAAKRGRTLNIISGQVVELPNFMLRRLADDKRVLSIVHDRKTGGEMNRSAIVSGARAVQDLLGYDGAGVGVAVIDSGVTAWHDDLTYQGNDSRVKVVAGQRTVKFVDFVNGRTTPYDDNGHGSHVAGIILGNGRDTFGARAGIAPAANLISLKVLDDHGGGYISNVIAALEWAVTNKVQYKIRVINLSVGAAVSESYTTDPLCLAAKRAVDAGIVVVTAAGNLGKNAAGQVQYGGITAPGNAPWVLTVGAYSHEGTLTRTDDKMGLYSSRGPTAHDFGAKPDVVATGTGIVSLSVANSLFYQTKAAYLLKGSLNTGAFKPYLSLTGTSMAAPMVAGTVALMLEANPNLTPNLVKAIIEYTAQDYHYNALTQGAGFLNSKGAVDLAKFLKAPQAGQHYPTSNKWSRAINWGNLKLKKGLITPTANAWALSTVWGADTNNSGENIVWGTACHGNNNNNDPNCENIVWGTATDTSNENIVWGSADDSNRENIVWGSECHGDDCDGVVWGMACSGSGSGSGSGSNNDSNCENIVWGTAGDCPVGDLNCENIVWGTSGECPVGDLNCENIVWGTNADVPSTVWGSSSEADNTTWGCAGEQTQAFDDPDVPTLFDGQNFDDLFDAPVPPPVAPPVDPPPAIVPDPPVDPPPAPPAGGGGF
jgi:serine protease AprX